MREGSAEVSECSVGKKGNGWEEGKGGGRNGEREGVRTNHVDGGIEGAGLPLRKGGAFRSHPRQHGQGRAQEA